MIKSYSFCSHCYYSSRTEHSMLAAGAFELDVAFILPHTHQTLAPLEFTRSLVVAIIKLGFFQCISECGL